jgi:hypothetical protein
VATTRFPIPITGRSVTRAKAVAALALAASGAGPLDTSAVAASPRTASFNIAPARRVVVGRPPLRLAPTENTNTTDQLFGVRVFPALLSQRVDGSFSFGESPLALRDASRLLSVTPGSYFLDRGESRSIAIRWKALPRGTRSAAIGLVVTGTPRTAAGRGVRYIGRLVGLNLLRLPGRFLSDGTFTALRAEQAGPGALRFFSRVHNAGEIFDTPAHTTLTIQDAVGRTVAHTHWLSDVVLPGADVDFPADISRPLAAGRYSARAEYLDSVHPDRDQHPAHGEVRSAHTHRQGLDRRVRQYSRPRKKRRDENRARGA